MTRYRSLEAAIDEFERIAADCLAQSARDPSALDRACSQHPALAEQIRGTFEQLARIGMLGGANDGDPLGRNDLLSPKESRLPSEPSVRAASRP